jgi:hypothetical protein
MTDDRMLGYPEGPMPQDDRAQQLDRLHNLTEGVGDDHCDQMGYHADPSAPYDQYLPAEPEGQLDQYGPIDLPHDWTNEND